MRPQIVAGRRGWVNMPLDIAFESDWTIETFLARADEVEAKM
jgi:hypothetical protein